MQGSHFSLQGLCFLLSLYFFSCVLLRTSKCFTDTTQSHNPASCVSIGIFADRSIACTKCHSKVKPETEFHIWCHVLSDSAALNPLAVCAVALLDCHPSAVHMAFPTPTLLPGSVYYISSTFGASRQGPRCPPSARTSWLFWLTSPAGAHCTSASGFCLAGTGSKGESCLSGLAKGLSWATPVCLEREQDLPCSWCVCQEM